MQLPFGYYLAADFKGNFLPFVGFLLILFVLVLWTNRQKGVAAGTSTGGAFYLIILLRSLFLLILLLLLFNPNISLTRTYTEAGKVVLLVDQSQSMREAWIGNDTEVSSSIRDYIKHADVQYNIELRDLQGSALKSADIHFDKPFTNFGWTPMQPEERRGIADYRAVFLFTDGHLNRGRSPILEDWTHQLPIFPVFPQPPRLNKHIEIQDVSESSGNASKSSTFLGIDIEQSNCRGDSAVLIILDEQKQELSRNSITFTERFSRENLTLEIDRSQNRSLTVLLENRALGLGAEHPVELLQRQARKHILLLSETPDFLHRFLLGNIPDSTYDLTSFTGISPQHKTEAIPSAADSIDLVILNEPGELLVKQGLAPLLEHTVKQGIPLILFNSGISGHLDLLSDYLGITGDSSDWSGELPVFLSQNAKADPVLIGAQGRGFRLEDINRYPPIKIYPHYVYKPGAQPILTSLTGQAAGQVLWLDSDQPLAVFRGGEIWRWFFHPQSRQSFQILWAYLLEYMQELAHFKAVELSIFHHATSTGAQIPFEVHIRDIDGTLLRAQVSIWQENEAGERELLEVTRSSENVYSGVLNSTRAGEFNILAEAQRYGELWGRDTSKIRLAAFNEESQSKGVDQIFLQRLAERSAGGKIVRNIHELPSLEESSVEKTNINRFKGVRSPLLLLLLCATAIGEWILRRGKGML